MRISHLDPEDVSKIQNGQKINAGDFISKQKNTGTIIAGKGRGVLDITTWGPDGKPRSGQETEQIIRSQSVPTGAGFDPK